MDTEPIPLVYDHMRNQYEGRCPDCREVVGILTEEYVVRRRSANRPTPLLVIPATHTCHTGEPTP